jgi:hypothetical protein
MAKNFTAEQFQPALTLIEQRCTEDLTVWDAELNSDSKLPFSRTTSAQRLLVFFASPSHLSKIKNELAQREAEKPSKPAEAPVGKAPAAAKPKAKGKIKTKSIGATQKARGRKAKAAKAVKKKPQRSQRSNPPHKRHKQKSLPAKAQKFRARKNRKTSKSKRS